MAEKPHRKGHSHFVTVISETWKETELREVVVNDLAGGVMTVLLAIMFHFAKQGELAELLFLAVAGGACGVVVGFVFRLLFVTPGNIYRKLNEEIATKDVTIKNLNFRIQSIVDAKPELQLVPSLTDRDIEGKHFCWIGVKNRSKTATAKQVKVEIINIEPSPVMQVYSFMTGDVPYPIRLRPSEADGDTINPGCISKFDVFVVNRPTTIHDKKEVVLSLSVYFAGRPGFFEDRPDLPRFKVGGFKPELADKKSGEFKPYFMKIRVSAEGVEPVEKRCSVFFTFDLSQDAVQIA